MRDRVSRLKNDPFSLELLETRTLLAATWTSIANPFGAGPNAIIQLSDGSVMMQLGSGQPSNEWVKLTPNSSGSYVNGTWTRLAPSLEQRLDFGSQLLKDGRVFVDGGEYGAAGSLDPTTDDTAEIYDPVTNTWTQCPPQPYGAFVDSMSDLLPNGDVLITPVFPSQPGYTTIYHVATNTWSQGPKLFRGTSADEQTFVKLADDSLLTIDSNTTSERYIPSLNKFINDGAVPVPMYDSQTEIGGGMLLADGRVFFVGATGNTALYTPTGTTAPGTWVAGPTLPVVAGAQLGQDDAPIAMLRDGRILIAAGPSGTYNGPTHFYTFNPTTNTLSAVTGAPNISDPVFAALFMGLPDNTLLYTTRFSSPSVYVYDPGTTPLAPAKPTISNVAANSDGSYTLTGTLLNGINEGNSYGDDQQQDTNFPIIRLTSGSNVYYARTYNWSSTGVATGNLAETTRFNLPLGLAAGTYSLTVESNGFPSDPVPFTLSTVGNAVPTVSQAATSSLNPVSVGTTATFSALGADDGGESNLKYTWTVTPSSGLTELPSFSINGTNTSKSTSVTFNERGTFTFKVTMTDLGGLSTSSSVTVNVTSTALPAAAAASSTAAVANRQIFYNNSSFDGDANADPASDSSAIATDKSALLPGQTATFANYTGYSRGINGLIVDIANLPSVTLTAADFSFKTGTTADINSWSDAPAPSLIQVFRGAGVNGSDRVEILWPDGSIVNRWLQVKVKANDKTGLAAPDVFYYGNLVGETGNTAAGVSQAVVNTADVLTVRSHQSAVAAINSPYDFNRDGQVSAADTSIAAAMNQSTLLLTAPGTPAVGARSKSSPTKPTASALPPGISILQLRATFLPDEVKNKWFF